MKTIILSIIAAVLIGLFTIHVIDARTIWEPDPPDVIGSVNSIDIQHVRDEKKDVDCYAMQVGSLSPAISCVLNKN